MKNAKKTNRKVSEITNELKNDFLSAEISAKLDAISEKSLADKSTLNRSIWKKEILQNFKTEKTARRILRNQQEKFSVQVIKFAKLQDNTNLKIASANLEKFYSENLIERSKFSNKDADKKDNNLVYLASEISLKIAK